MVMGVRRPVVVLALVFLGPPTVGVEDRGMVVFVDVVAAAMLELAQRATRVVVGYVVVVMGMNDARMRMLVLDITGDALSDLRLSHRPVPPRRISGPRDSAAEDLTPPPIGPATTLSRGDSTVLPRSRTAHFKALAVASPWRRPSR